VAGDTTAMAGRADGSPSRAREYEFSDRDFQRVRRMVYQQTGIALSESKRQLVYGRLSRRLRALQLREFDTYLSRVEGGDAEELQHFRNAITTNLTSFFRENHHFEFLANQLMPHLEFQNRASRRIRIWSAGCSTGEEPYSIAMVLLESAAHLTRSWDVRILATDIDTNVLEHATRGIYNSDRVEKMDSSRLLRWFDRVPGEEHFRVGDAVKRLVTFRELNLISDWPMKGPFDVIFCRNVVIYFDRETQRQIVGRMEELQRPGDYLILGHSESLLDISTRYRLVGNTIHRRAA
jgi:chemotaxis protein methyltransferase CheR